MKINAAYIYDAIMKRWIGGSFQHPMAIRKTLFYNHCMQISQLFLFDVLVPATPFSNQHFMSINMRRPRVSLTYVW